MDEKTNLTIYERVLHMDKKTNLMQLEYWSAV